jgi:hypothetical protein
MLACSLGWALPRCSFEGNLTLAEAVIRRILVKVVYLYAAPFF